MDNQYDQTTGTNEQSSSVTVDDSTLLGLLKSRLEIAKVFCKKPHEAMKKWMNEYNISDWDDTDEIREKVRIGYLFRKTESELPTIFDDQPDLFIKGKNASAREIEPLITGLYDYLWQVQDMDTIIEDAGTYFLVIGMGFVKSPYVTKTKQVPVTNPIENTEESGEDPIEEAGETPDAESLEEQAEPEEPQEPQLLDVPIVDNPVAEVINPLKLFFSPETTFSVKMDYKHCPYYIEKTVMTREEVKARFGKDVDPNETLVIDDDGEKKNSNQDNQLVLKDDIKRVTVYEYYGVLPKEKVKEVKGASAWDYDKDYHIFFTTSTILLAEECPYEQKPLFVMGNYGFSNKFWKFGDAKHLMPLIEELQMYRTQVLRFTRKMANPKLLLPMDGEYDEQAIMDPRVGRPVKFRTTPPSYLQPSPLGREVIEGIDIVRTDLEKTAGSFDLENGGNESQVKSPKGIEVYSQAADKNIERKRKKVARFIKELLIFQFKQIGQYWKPEDGKTLAVMDTQQDMTQPTDGQASMMPQDPQAQNPQPNGVQVTAEVLQVISGVGQLYNLDIEVESMAINKAQIKQDAIDLFTVATEHPDIFNIQQVAKDLLQNGYGKKDADRYLLTDAQRAQMAAGQKPQLGENLSIKADAATPVGAQLLEEAGLLPQGSAQALSAASQVQNSPMPPELAPPPANGQPPAN